MLGSVLQDWNRSLSEISALLPSETTLEKPILDDLAQSRTDVSSAHDCDMKLIFPFAGLCAENEAFMGQLESIIPRQLGPSILIP